MIQDTNVDRNPVPDGYVLMGTDNLIEAAKKAADDKIVAGRIRMYSEEYPDWDKPIPAHIPVGDPNDKRSSLEAMKEIHQQYIEKQAADKAAQMKETKMSDNNKVGNTVDSESPIALVSRAIDTVTGLSDGKVVEGVTQEVTIIADECEPEAPVVTVFEVLDLEEEIAAENHMQEEIPAFLLKPEKEQHMATEDKLLAESDAEFAKVLEEEELYAARVPKVKGKLHAQIEENVKTAKSWINRTMARVTFTTKVASPQMSLARVKRAFGRMHEHLDEADVAVNTRLMPLFRN